jgi:hypothetical protein
VSASGQQPSCSLCPANTFSPQGAIEDCTPCPVDTVSKNGSDSQADCHDRWQKLKKDFDYLPLLQGTTSTTNASGSITSETQCRQACDAAADCVFYVYYKGVIQDTCTLYLAAAASAEVQMGMKVEEGVYSVAPVPISAYNMGTPVDSTAADFVGVTASHASDINDAWLLATSDAAIAVAACTRRCDEVEGCVVALVHQVVSASPTSYACGLRTGAMGAYEKTMYRISGSNMDRWFTSTPWGAGV